MSQGHSESSGARGPGCKIQDRISKEAISLLPREPLKQTAQEFLPVVEAGVVLRMVAFPLAIGRHSNWQGEQGAGEEGSKRLSVTVSLVEQGRCPCGANTLRGTEAMAGSGGQMEPLQITH